MFDMFKGKRVFVSGGAGVIGRGLVARLERAGAEVLVGDLKPRPPEFSRAVAYWQGDLNELPRSVLEDFAPEICFHLAATFERSTESYEFWQENDRHNVKLSHYLLDLVKDMPQLQRVVFASSYLIYDPALYQYKCPAERPRALREDDPVRPRNLCGMAKLQHEMELSFVSSFRPSLGVVSARIFRVYGKDSRDVVSRWIRALLRGETLRVFRKEGMFDYIYADDVAEGLFRLAACGRSGVVNLGSGRARRVSELLEVLRRHFPDMQWVEEDSDIPFEASQADMGRFREWTGWLPERALEDAVPELIEYYRGQMAEAGKNEEHRDRPEPAVLVTSASKKVPLIHSLKEAAARSGRPWRVVAADSDETCIARHFADGFWKMPKLAELTVRQLAEKCQELGVQAIVPTRDGELSFFARHRAELEAAGVAVMVSGEGAIERCTDKLLFYKYLETHGFPVIPTFLCADEVPGDALVVKERYGAGARKMALNVSRGQAKAHAASLEHPVFQPFVEGCEISADLYVTRSGLCKGVVLRRREKVVDGESQVTATFRDEKLERLCADMARELGLYGHAVAQWIVDREGRFHLVECNPRVGGASRLSWQAGLRSLDWFLAEALGKDTDAIPYCRAEREMRMVRYPADRFATVEPGSAKERI
jgi:carbamoyl-phosphate synthase large subunit